LSPDLIVGCLNANPGISTQHSTPASARHRNGSCQAPSPNVATSPHTKMARASMRTTVPKPPAPVTKTNPDGDHHRPILRGVCCFGFLLHGRGKTRMDLSCFVPEMIVFVRMVVCMSIDREHWWLTFKVDSWGMIVSANPRLNRAANAQKSRGTTDFKKATAAKLGNLQKAGLILHGFGPLKRGKNNLA